MKVRRSLKQMQSSFTCDFRASVKTIATQWRVSMRIIMSLQVDHCLLILMFEGAAKCVFCDKQSVFTEV